MVFFEKMNEPGNWFRVSAKSRYDWRMFAETEVVNLDDPHHVQWLRRFSTCAFVYPTYTRIIRGLVQ